MSSLLPDSMSQMGGRKTWIPIATVGTIGLLGAGAYFAYKYFRDSGADTDFLDNEDDSGLMLEGDDTDIAVTWDGDEMNAENSRMGADAPGVESGVGPENRLSREGTQ